MIKKEFTIPLPRFATSAGQSEKPESQSQDRRRRYEDQIEKAAREIFFRGIPYLESVSAGSRRSVYGGTRVRQKTKKFALIHHREVCSVRLSRGIHATYDGYCDISKHSTKVRLLYPLRSLSIFRNNLNPFQDRPKTKHLTQPPLSA